MHAGTFYHKNSESIHDLIILKETEQGQCCKLETGGGLDGMYHALLLTPELILYGEKKCNFILVQSHKMSHSDVL